MRWNKIACLVAGLWIVGSGNLPQAQTFWHPEPPELVGLWSPAYHEEWHQFGEGPRIGDYTGLPFNDAARYRAMAWSPSSLNMPERQCMPLPLDYALTWSNLHIWKDVDQYTQEITAYQLQREWGEIRQTIYMDGRPHPSGYAPYTWQGFSTGEWQGNILKVTTTHLREGFMSRNGVPRSDRATIIQFYIRHGDYLTIVRITEDPVYLTEPAILSSNHTANLHRHLYPYPCEVVTELPSLEQAAVPHYLPWKNQFIDEFAREVGIPLDASMGGAGYMYPEYVE